MTKRGLARILAGARGVVLLVTLVCSMLGNTLPAGAQTAEEPTPEPTASEAPSPDPSPPEPSIDPSPSPSSEPTSATDPSPTPSPTEPSPATAPTIESDKAQYIAGELVTLTGHHWAPAEPVHIVVNDDQGQTWRHEADVIADVSGDFVDQFNLPMWFVAVYTVTATGPLSGTATTTFADPPQADLDQCQNGTWASPAICNDPPGPVNNWANGNVNQNNAHYREGDSASNRTRFGSLNVNTIYTYRLEWQTTNSGRHATDYLTTYNRTNTTADPCSGVAGCGSVVTDTFSIPIDPNVTKGPDGTLATTDDISQIPGVFTCFDCDITTVGTPGSEYAVAGSYSGTSDTEITITFVAKAANPVLAWGGHLANQIDWGSGSSVGFIQGSSYHMTQDACSNNITSCGNQDRSMSTAAVVPAPLPIVTDASTGSAVTGQQVTDTATFSPVNSNLPNGASVDGTAAFFVCGPGASNPSCAAGGTPLGSVTISGNAATSAPFTPSQAGNYCFRAEFTPAAGEPYSPGEHTNQTTEDPANSNVHGECFTVTVAAGSISATKYLDRNENGSRQPDGADTTSGTPDDEVGLSGWTLFIDKDADETLDGDEVSQTTNSSGVAVFSSLAAGTYSVCEVLQSQWSNSDPAGATLCKSVTVESGQATTSFGNFHDAGTLNIDKTGPATVGHGGTITYQMDVSYTPGADGSPAQNITVSDPGCDTGTLSGPVKTTAVDADNDADAFLEAGETWRYTCTKAVSATHSSGEADPIENTASVSGKDLDGDPVTGDTDGHSVDVTHDAGTLNIDKTASLEKALPGTTVTYTFDITYSPGPDGSPAQNITVSDPECDGAISGPNKSTGVDSQNNADAFLEAGETWRYTCTSVLERDTTNTASVNGKDYDGDALAQDTDTAFVDALPTVTVTKTASPLQRPEPGGSFTFTITVTNTSSSADTVTLTDLSDDVYGNLDKDDVGNHSWTSSTCDTDRTVSPLSSYMCSFKGDFSGVAGATQTDTVTAKAHDEEGNEAAGSDDATVTLTVGSASIMTNSAFQLVTDLSPWTITDFEILMNPKYEIIATNPGQFYYHQRAENNYNVTTKWEFKLNWPDEFQPQTSGGNPIHAYVYLNGQWVDWTSNATTCWSSCVGADGTAVVSNVPAGADIWITAHLDYKLKGTTQSSTFLKTPKTYGPFQSDIVVKDSTGTTPMPGGTSTSSTSLIGRGKKVTMVYGVATDPDGNLMPDVWIRLTQGTTRALTKTDSSGFYVFFDGQQCTTTDSLYGCSAGLTSLAFGSGNVTLTVLGKGGSTPPVTAPSTWENSSQILPAGTSTVTVSGACSSPLCTLSVTKGNAYLRNWKFG